MSSTASGLEQFYDERVNAERLSHLCATEHYEMVLKAGDMERCIGDLVWHLEEPRVGQSYPNYYAARLASRFGKVVLSGTGGDELFGGYPWRYYRAVVNDDFEHYIDKYYQLLAAADAELDPARGVSARGGPDGGGLDARYLPRRLCLPCRRARPAGGLRQSLALSRSQDLSARPPGGGGQALHGALAGERGCPSSTTTWSTSPCGCRSTFKLGNLGAVVRLNENEPGRKTKRYFERTNDGKLLLRKVLGRYVGTEVMEREKQGFSAPDASWFRGESIDYVRDRLLSPSARIYDWMDYGTVAGLIEEHLTGRRNRRLLIWSLLYVEEWSRCFLGVQAQQARLVGFSSG